jgi:hypothetical protein
MGNGHQRSILAHADLSRGSPGTVAGRGRNGAPPARGSGPVCRSAARGCWLVPGSPVARVRCRRPARSGGACRAAPLLASTVAICRAAWHGWAAGCWSSSPPAACFRPRRGSTAKPVGWWAPRCSSRNSGGTTTAFGTGHLEQRGHHDGVRHRPFGTAGAPGPRSGVVIWNSAGTTTAFGTGHLEQRGHHDPSDDCGWLWAGRCYPQQRRRPDYCSARVHTVGFSHWPGPTGRSPVSVISRRAGGYRGRRDPVRGGRRASATMCPVMRRFVLVISSRSGT